MDKACITKQPQGLSVFEKYLTAWVLLCIGAGIVLGKLAPQAARYLDSLAITANGAPVVSIPIAICLFFMMYPIMVKIDFSEVVKAGQVGQAGEPDPGHQLADQAVHHGGDLGVFPGRGLQGD